ncbi:cell division protein FtsZ [Dyadobacter fermentans]|uniref:Cell division protein FtsZ n=1 Tax=Dyadobacter fermentans (strain ATCC 700827 / DSM 18053 / CIP 107007 / KCTC 52180 / NS114) TaxID=471854 RepID=C6VT49_DYAFD|nr:cell division protein FtsZ [Dyadobacter fermentans]ACT94694.1 cell division protein FtsZ [Dyadobacter fermentans DSM 18053]
MNKSLLHALDQDYIVNEIVKDQPNGEGSGDPAIIKVIGVGGGGSNAVNYMFQKKIKDVEFAVCNTDRQALANSPVPVKIQLGATLTQGLGAGTDATKGKEAALETIEEIKGLLGGSTQMVFITAGMGGGTGTGAAPVIAQLAKEMGKLTVAVVTAPYTWEGLDKKEQALEGIEQLKEYSDTVLVVLNDKLEELYEDMTLTQAFAEADGILLNAVKSISEIITTNGNINTDFKDVEKVLKSAGQSVMGTSESTGAERAQKAIKEALDSPLLNDRDIRGAKRILVTLATSKKKEATMKEQREIWQYVLSQVGGEARMFKLGTITDDSLDDKLRVTIVAAGFDSIESPIPGIQLKGLKGKQEVHPVAVPEPVVEIPEPVAVEEEELVLTGELEENTPTGSIDIVLENEPVTRGFDPINISLTELEPQDEWTNEDALKMELMINSFKDGLVKFADLEGPAFRRSRVELWKRPAIPAQEMEQHWLK